MEIYASAQLFGYGPTSNLFTLLRALQRKCKNNIAIKLIRNDVAETFHELNPDVDLELTDELDIKKAELIISSFDPAAILIGWLYDIPTVYSCNLFWYWDVENKYQEIIEYIENLLRLKNQKEYALAIQLFHRLLDRDSHMAIFLGYILATHCFIRTFPEMQQKIKNMPFNIAYTKTNILMPYAKKPVKKPSNIIYIQLAGSCNPILSIQENVIYVDTVVTVLASIANLFQEYQFIICINPKLYEIIAKDTPENVDIVESLSQQENMQHLQNAAAVFTSTGLETIFEANYFSTPLFLLPEQNAGQYGNFDILQKSGFEPYRFLINEEFPKRKKLAGEHDAHSLMEVLAEIKDSPELLSKFLIAAQSFLTMLVNDQEKQQYVTMQKRAINKHIGMPAYSHGDAVAEAIVDQFISPQQRAAVY